MKGEREKVKDHLKSFMLKKKDEFPFFNLSYSSVPQKHRTPNQNFYKFGQQALRHCLIITFVGQKNLLVQ
jgi:hypothetical protein